MSFKQFIRFLSIIQNKAKGAEKVHNYFIMGKKNGLRKLNSNDITEKYVSWMNDREVTKFLESGYFPTDLEALHQYVASQNTDRSLFLGIFDILSDNHVYIGNVKLANINWIHRTAEFGIMIGEKDYWGKGYGTEVTHLLIDYGFQILNLRKIYLGVFGNHESAIKAYEKAGFEVEGIMKNHLFLEGNYVDKVWMSVFNK